MENKTAVVIDTHGCLALNALQKNKLRPEIRQGDWSRVSRAHLFHKISPVPTFSQGKYGNS